MAITFPASPADGATYTNPTTGVQYIYNTADGVWKTYVWPTNTNYLQLTGGTLTGDLALGTNDLSAQDITSTTLTTTGGLTVGNGLTVSDGNIEMAAGHGIDFSATANGSGTMTSELLDDYEEGTWTPDINLSGGTNTVHTAWGKYTKIGNIVYLWFRMVFNNTTTASIYELQNLPFVVGGMSSQFPGPSISNFYKINLGSGGTVLGGYWKNGVNELRFHSCGNNTQQNTPSIGQANTNIEIRGQGYYSVS